MRPWFPPTVYMKYYHIESYYIILILSNKILTEVYNMVVFRKKELLKANNITRYKLQQLTEWNYRRINAFYFGRVKQITIDEIEKLCEILKCDISDLMKVSRE